MPGFVKTAKDEARWAKAKAAASKETEEGSEGYWKLSNYIYHKMGKTEEDNKMAELYKSEITNGFKSGKELNIENVRRFLMNDTPEKQSILSNEVRNMSDEKKYTAKEAAMAVLKKAEEVLKKSEVLKKEHKHIGWNKLHSKLEHEGYSAKSADKIAGSVKAKMNKAEPVGKIHPKEPQAGEAEHPGARIEHQVAPENNPKEQAEGNNPDWGTAPGVKGHIKLAKFCGHMQSKRKKMPGAM